jgi:hypothetical protein
MFFTFLNKDDHHYLEFSVFAKYNPEQLIYYYYNSDIRIPLDTYSKIIELADNQKRNSNLRLWSKLFQEELGMEPEINSLKDNEYILASGPYYYERTNTRFFVTKNLVKYSDLVTADDLETLRLLEEVPRVDKEIITYYNSRKNKKNKGKSDLLKEISICIECLRETENLHKHINYFNKLLENRYSMVEEKLTVCEPEDIPDKPVKAPDTERNFNNIIPFNVIKSRKKRQNQEEDGGYNRALKIYFIRYREYEKAMERYKNALINWEENYQILKNQCLKEIEILEEKVKLVLKNLAIYNGIIEKSYIHSSYQDVKTLTSFKHYLETGRANELQDCMNLFEEERLWAEIKASQERIENTIYFLQNGNDNTRLADEHISQLIKKADPAPGTC